MKKITGKATDKPVLEFTCPYCTTVFESDEWSVDSIAFEGLCRNDSCPNCKKLVFLKKDPF